MVEMSSVIYVSTQEEFEGAFKDHTTIELLNDIIYNMYPVHFTRPYEVLVINGKGFKLDASGLRSVYAGCHVLSIANAQDVTIYNLCITGGFSEDELLGGGLLSDNSVITMVNCVITKNRAFVGGGIAVYNSMCIGPDCKSELALYYCTISFNTATDLESLDDYVSFTDGGGGVYVAPSTSLILVGCKFESNHAISSDFPSGKLSDVSLNYQGVKIAKMAMYSACTQPGTFGVGTGGGLACSGCTESYPSDLLNSPCLPCPSGSYSCCGALECTASDRCSTFDVSLCRLNETTRAPSRMPTMLPTLRPTSATVAKAYRDPNN